MAIKFCLDANIFIEGWNRIYPIDIFPTLWGNISLYTQEMILIKPIYEEIFNIDDLDKKSSEEQEKEKSLRTWMDQENLSGKPLPSQVTETSIQLEQKYQTNEGKRGANQVDISLISYAKVYNIIVVTLESPQPRPPAKACNYKIPLICEKENVRCINFVGLLKECRIIV